MRITGVNRSVCQRQQKYPSRRPRSSVCDKRRSRGDCVPNRL